MVLTSGSETNAIAGALGSVIGYLGSEVAEPSLFEYLLWPQRFYAQTSGRGFVRSSLMLPMGGPIHKAALATLDAFRKKGLYKGKQQGHMLGTAFYSNTGLKYRLHNYNGIDHDNEIRNGLWANVIRALKDFQPSISQPGSQRVDDEKSFPEPASIRRARQRVQHLKLTVLDNPASIPKGVKVFSEDRIHIGMIATICASESTAIGCATAIAAIEHCWVFSAYLCLPLLFKLVAVVCSVRREPLEPSTKAAEPLILPAASVLIEVLDYDYGFPLIEGPEAEVRKFFKHWGHPFRQNNTDRVREWASMALVMSFVFIFPIGLLSMLWVNQTIQIIWLSYQMYMIVVMHLNRLLGYQAPGRIEDALAFELATKGIVFLKSQQGGVLQVRLETIMVDRISDGQKVVLEIVKQHAKQCLKASA